MNVLVQTDSHINKKEVGLHSTGVFENNAARISYISTLSDTTLQSRPTCERRKKYQSPRAIQQCILSLLQQRFAFGCFSQVLEVRKTPLVKTFYIR